MRYSCLKEVGAWNMKPLLFSIFNLPWYSVFSVQYSVFSMRAQDFDVRSWAKRIRVKNCYCSKALARDWNLISSELFHSYARKPGHKWGIWLGHVHDWEATKQQSDGACCLLNDVLVPLPIWTWSSYKTILVLIYNIPRLQQGTSTEPLEYQTYGLSTPLFK